MGNIDFNTSHVYINRRIKENQNKDISISIHLMFILIIVYGKKYRKDKDFNTSHVYINPFCFKTSSKGPSNFNTSHVYINQNELEKNQITMEFQYISCLY